MADDPKSKGKGERLAKRIAAAGVCSRRDAEQLITAGLVRVNGQVVQTPAFNVMPADVIIVRGKTLDAVPDVPRLFRYHKPTGLMVTARDPQGRETVFDTLPADLPRVVSVGRLDLNSEGLLLLTTSGTLARHLEHPDQKIPRTYRVRAYGDLPSDLTTRLQRGITIDGIRYGSITARIERSTGSNHWILMTLFEGKNREIRKVLSAMGLAVNRLIRTSYGPFQLGSLPPGHVQEVPSKQIKPFLNVAPRKP